MTRAAAHRCESHPGPARPGSGNLQAHARAHRDGRQYRLRDAHPGVPRAQARRGPGEPDPGSAAKPDHAAEAPGPRAKARRPSTHPQRPRRDSRPERFGHALIDAWLATEGRRPESFNAVERLCYFGVRGMGALEYAPAIGPPLRASTKVSLAALVALASEVLTHRNSLEVSFAPGRRPEGLTEILRVGTSAAGARAKAIIAWNRETNQVRSGQVKAPPGFSYWLLKFDGVSANKDKELEDPQGYTLIEYAYSLMARDAGIEMSECRLLEEGGRRHFMTRRFDRESDGGKLHMQSLAALAHFDFNSAGVYGYEQALDVMKRLALPMRSIEQQFRRMLFNVVARNHDDHVKNIAFLMDKSGAWSLSPAFDVTYAYNPAGLWTARHQMTINGKTDGFELADLRPCAQVAGLQRGREEEILAEVVAAVQEQPGHPHRAG